MCNLVRESAWNWKQGQDLRKKINLLNDEALLKKREARIHNEKVFQAMRRETEARASQDPQEVERHRLKMRKNEEAREEAEDCIQVLTRRRLELRYEMGKHERKFNELEVKMKSDLRGEVCTDGQKKRRSEPNPRGKSCCECKNCECACHVEVQV